jgi:hypothetical protein
LPGTAQSELVELYSNFFNPEDGESMFLWNTGVTLQQCTVWEHKTNVV